MFERTDRYIGIGFIIFGALMFYLSTTWPMNFSADPAGPAAIPKILCVGLIILGAIVAAGGFGVKAKAEAPFATKDELIITGALTIACILYIVILPYIGYLLATPLLLAAILLSIGSRKAKTVILVSVVGTIVLFVLFYSILQVNLPLGFMKEFISGIVPRI